MSNIGPVVTSSTSTKKKKKKASSENKTTHMKNKEGILADDYEPLSKLIECLSLKSITTKEAFEVEATKYKLKKNFLERVAHSLAKHGIVKLFKSSANIASMKHSMFNNKATILEKLKDIQIACILPVYIASHTVANDNLLKTKPALQTSVMLVVKHDTGYVNVGKGRVIGYVTDDTKVQISVSAVESNSNVVFHNEEFMIGLIDDWSWELLALDFADLNRVSPGSLVNMTSLLDPQNNHVDNSDIFAPLPTIPHNMSTTPQSPRTMLQPKSSSNGSSSGSGSSSSSSSGSNIGSYSGLGNSSNNSGAISLHNSTGGMGNIITNNGIVSNYGLEQQKRFFEEKLIQQQNEFQEKLVQQQNEFQEKLVQQEIEFQKALNEQCNHLKRKVEELETLESTAKKKCTELENRIAIQKKKVKERVANIWPDEDDADDDDPKSFILRGISHTLTDQQVTDFKVCSQFGVAIERLMAIAKITAINESDFSDLEKAIIILTNVETPRTAKKRKKRFQNLKHRYSHLFQEEGALGCDNGGSSSGGSSDNVGASSFTQE